MTLVVVGKVYSLERHDALDGSSPFLFRLFHKSLQICCALQLLSPPENSSPEFVEANSLHVNSRLKSIAAVK